MNEYEERAQRSADRQAKRDERRRVTEAAIDSQLSRADSLTPDEILTLVIAQRLHGCSDNVFAAAMGGTEAKPPLNFWGKR